MIQHVRMGLVGFTFALSMMLAMPTGAHAAGDAARGELLYMQKCASCHGKDGKGTGPIGKRLTPPPVDFTDPSGTPTKGDAELLDKIARGGKGTAMPAFRSLSAQQHADVLAYIRTIAGR